MLILSLPLCVLPFSERVSSQSQRRLLTEMGMSTTGECDRGPSSRYTFTSLVLSCVLELGQHPVFLLQLSTEHNVPRWLWQIKDIGHWLLRKSHAGETQSHRAVLCHENTGQAKGQWCWDTYVHWCTRAWISVCIFGLHSPHEVHGWSKKKTPALFFSMIDFFPRMQLAD